EGVLIDLAASRAKASRAFLSILLILSHDWLNYKQIHNLNYRLSSTFKKEPFFTTFQHKKETKKAKN
ncbi:hypothetical protein, partial [Vibrio metschnikovii]|uniref:hypothetical protein n=1 Tax=Vibrio metschnikovii TaxID=28172 RepID=UPI001C2F2F60